MWSAIARIFTKNEADSVQSGDESGCAKAQSMDRGEIRRADLEMQDSYETTQTKQRAAVKWLLSKAFNNKVPKNLSEPFYRDHEQEHLKPPIIGSLANAEMYCMALGNIYSDPNYHNLSHWSILQTLARKGVCVTEPSNSALTETTLIQTNPLRLNAHMAVIESIMTLYAREVVTPDRVLAAIQRFSHGKSAAPSMPETHEQGLLMWISHTCEALQKKIEQQLETGVSNGGEGDRLKAPSFPPINELKDLCDGAAIAALIAYYCPDELPWTEIKVPRLPTVSESLHNLGLVQDFCNRCLPSSIFHMMPADITYMRGSMKQNLVVFLADLFNVVEIHPVKCVRYPGMDRTTTVTRSTPTHTPLRKTNSFQQSVSEMSEDSLRRGSDDSFIVHRGKNIPTLSSVVGSERTPNANKERQNNDTKADERGESKAAGKPSNWDDQKKPSFAGRRSRRNSMTEDSQLTIENFGGSQDNLNFIGRNPDKEVAVHVGRKISAPSAPVPIENPAVRSTLQDARGSFQLGYDNGCDKPEIERENFKLKKQLSSDDISLRNAVSEFYDQKNRMSFADTTNHVGPETKNVQSSYTQQQQQQQEDAKDDAPPKSSFKSSNPHTNGEKKTTSFATLPNTTTWQLQSSHNQQSVENNGNGDDSTGNNQMMSSQLSDIRMKLEEKRRHIETEKRKIEFAMNKQRQKVGNAAFLQAVVKGKGNVLKSPNDAMTDSLVAGDSEPSTPTPEPTTSKPQRPFTLQEISDDASTVERKWLDQDQPYIETRRTPDIENMDVDQYHQSMANLHDIQADIQRLAHQQKQIQVAQEQNLAAQQKQLYQQQQGYMTIMQHTPYTSQQSYNPPQYQQGPMFTPLQSSASAPHIPQSLYQTHPGLNQQQFFLHSQQSTPSVMQSQQPVLPQRRTWAQQAQPPPIPNESYQQPDLRTWAKPHSAGGGFVLHESNERFQDKFQDGGSQRYQNGGEHTLNHSNSHPGFTLSQQHQQQQQQQQLYSGSHSTPSASPQHRNVHRQISQLMDDSKRTVSLQQIDQPARKSSVTHAPIPAPPVDDMAPQSISFIGNPDDDISQGLSRLNITSGTRTYRIPSPTRPLISRNAFQPSSPPIDQEIPVAEVSSLDNDPSNQKGFYISFDNEQPKRPKPQLRVKKMSPKKERSLVEDEPDYEQIQQALEKEHRVRQLERELEHDRLKKELEDRRKVEYERQRRETSQEREKASSALIIGNELSNPDPELIDEKERKKERIMMLSLQRRQQQEEAKQKKEHETQNRREKEKAKEEEKVRKKEEQAQRRAAIFEQYKLKKAIEEAEREGKDVDKSLLNSLKPTPKMRSKAATRPRPKTIHIDSGSVEMAEGFLHPSRGKKGSNSNLTAYNASTMKRDYYRGSQDSLAGSGLLYSKDSPDDSRGMSPCHSANQTLGRRSSYKTSRGSSTDQDSLAYRYGDTDSGLGRATPPRRAPSPGMGPMRHLPSPSGPGSLPGLMTKRRIFDDGSSDISSTPSSMMDYTGPRLYKQPTTKSNRGIMLNAVEYCVFPGVVNKEAKQKVLEEIARSESKHFLILFRDTGCQFRALYSYCPDREEVLKLYGTGPKQVNDRMFDKFFKYNSGGKCFSQVHTKHLTVTIDAFTIHNSLWQGKKVNLPNKKDMTLVI